MKINMENEFREEVRKNGAEIAIEIFSHFASQDVLDGWLDQYLDEKTDIEIIQEDMRKNRNINIP